MDFYRPFCRWITMPLWAKWERSEYLSHLETLRRFQYLGRDEILNYQFERVRKLVEHANENCSFYHALYSSAGFRPGDLRSWTDFTALPMVTKEMIRTNSERIVAKNFARDMLVPGKTSGSTGKPLEFFIDLESTQIQRAAALLTNEWAGHDIGGKVFVLFGQSPFDGGKTTLKGHLRNKLLDRTVKLSTLALDEESMSHFLLSMSSCDKPFLVGYAHALYSLADFAGKSGLWKGRLTGISSGGMVLHQWERKRIEEVFGCKVLDRYGCEELGVIACECERQEGLHINSFAKYVEIAGDNGKPLGHRQIGDIVVTELTNYGMPFIRYRIEDRAASLEGQCGCGRTLPLLEKIDGRESDFVLRPDGKKVSGISLTDNFGANIPGAEQVQILQDKLDHIIVRLVRGPAFNSESISAIQHLVSRFFGDDMRFSCEYVKEIPLESTGKARFVISQIPSA
jgi:phenylacetate-CoA ligase